ncbi:dimethyl sulfoxide reductase anchor subunit family protein [Elioraea rosea]|uniref:dimethyl sulfoxide reductase anchor subunit family protein n=1 Tax=Elioraea rosea TaxID=2492390 RepID=UPI001182CCC1|nr:DmsC/YnfH family molybdoenzyme membrane anchor subunit [Elioraea rosea]
MHPSTSVIFFTVASGAGYGLLAALALLAVIGLIVPGGGLPLLGLLLALGLITAGLLSSTLHLGHPERAWRAFSQWRSSWLSREGVASVATYLPAVLLAALFVRADVPRGLVVAVAVLAFAGAVATVVCTAMIYRSLKPIGAWHNRHTVPGYLIIGAATGFAVAYALFAGTGSSAAWVAGIGAIVALSAGFLQKRAYWRFLDTEDGPASPESATGLGGIGRVRLLDPPHTGPNFVMREMGYAVARRHAEALRRIVLVAGFVVPAWAIALGLGLAGGLAVGLGTVAAVSALLGAVVERWLFFAEARHTAMLYYGATRS